MSLVKYSLIPFTLLLLFCMILGGNTFCFPQQEMEKKATRDLQQEVEPDKIVGAPQDAKQKTGIWVFLIWVWISVFVLIYFLRLKIKEADRLYRLRFYSAKKN